MNSKLQTAKLRSSINQCCFFRFYIIDSKEELKNYNFSVEKEGAKKIERGRMRQHWKPSH